MKILFLILNYKTFNDTIKLANEILDENYDDYKILIVDNASPNNSYEYLSNAFGSNDFVDVIYSPENGGYAKGNNYGLRHAKKYNAEYVCIINNDVHFSKDTIECLISIWGDLEKPAIISPVQMLRGNQVAIFRTLSIPSLTDDIMCYFPFVKRSPVIKEYKEDKKGSNSMKVDYVPGAFLFTKFKIFEDLGFFDEDTFLFGEEKMLAKKIQLKGLNCYIITSLRYLHEHSKTINQEASSARQRTFLHHARLQYAKKYRNNPTLCTLILKIANLFNIIYFKLLEVLKKHMYHERKK